MNTCSLGRNNKIKDRSPQESKAKFFDSQYPPAKHQQLDQYSTYSA